MKTTVSNVWRNNAEHNDLSKLINVITFIMFAPYAAIGVALIGIILKIIG